MCQAAGMAEVDSDRRTGIHAAAVTVFSAQGFSATSMADIAEAAGVSRPALYQYFDNKADIFRSAFVALFDASVDAALEALAADGPINQRLDGYLQRFDGDFWERTAASPHSEEIMRAKVAHAAADVAMVIDRLRRGLADQLATWTTDEQRRRDWAELLEHAPKGFKWDDPSVADYRRRLTALANSVAADIER